MASSSNPRLTLAALDAKAKKAIVPDDDDDDDELNSLAHEVRLFLELAMPTTVVNFGTIICPLLTASVVGRKFGPIYLSGFTLANLTVNLSTFSLMAGLFSAADTLGPQYFGTGDNREVGLIAMRGFVAAILVLLPVNIVIVLFLKEILMFLGQNEMAATHASDWYRIFVFSLPFCILFNSLWKFLSAQHIMKPMIYVSVLSCGVILPLALNTLTEKYGFLGSAMAYVTFQSSQPVMLFLYLWWMKPYTPGTWPGIRCWKEALLRYRPMMEYIHLGVGGMFAQSEWVFWEALGLVIGVLGVIPLSVHAIPNQVAMLLCQLPFGAGNALTIRIGSTLPTSARHAKDIAIACATLGLAWLTVVNLLVFINSEHIIAFFTKDEEVKKLANAIWWKVCLYNESVAMYEILHGIANGLGLQWTMAGVNFFWLWIFGLPAIYYFSVTCGGQLQAAWSWINFPYLGMNSCLIIAFALTSWHEIAKKIRERESPPYVEEESLEHDDTEDENVGLLNDTIPNGYGSNKV